VGETPQLKEMVANFRMNSSDDARDAVVVLGGGLTGLSAGCVLARAGKKVRVLESDSEVGGLSKTVVRNGFRFDLGGHRFFTKDRKIDDFVTALMEDELIRVRRTSKIYMRSKYFNYPLKPLNAMFGLGIPTTIRIMADYGAERLRRMVKPQENVSLEDWVVSNFGRTMFNIYFKEYSEKVWGIDCSRISAEWVAQRIKGLSLAKAVKSAFFKVSGRDLPSLVDSFVYPKLGIGRISERLREEIEKSGVVHTGTRVCRVNRSGFRITDIEVQHNGGSATLRGGEFVSSVPITSLVRMLNPAPPTRLLEAAAKLKFRDLVVVAVMVNKTRVTDQTWIYIPEQNIPFGRIHEPTNWSEVMAPEGKTIVVTEFFSFKGDHVWNEDDARLSDITVRNLERLGFLKADEVIDTAVIRAAKAYPLFEVGYKELCDELYEYLDMFENLHISGRGGMFRYYNMDHAIESGMLTAEKIIEKTALSGEEDEGGDLVLAGSGR
jgi:protoporphyrinogen oxidase